jgi:hypothetical protein
MKTLSRRFRAEVKLSKTPGYLLATQAGLSPFVFSRLCTGRLAVADHEDALMKIAEQIGVARGEVFENDRTVRPRE